MRSAEIVAEVLHLRTPLTARPKSGTPPPHIFRISTWKRPMNISGITGPGGCLRSIVGCLFGNISTLLPINCQKECRRHANCASTLATQKSISGPISSQPRSVTARSCLRGAPPESPLPDSPYGRAHLYSSSPPHIRHPHHGDVYDAYFEMTGGRLSFMEGSHKGRRVPQLLQQSPTATISTATAPTTPPATPPERERLKRAPADNRWLVEIDYGDTVSKEVASPSARQVSKGHLLCHLSRL